MLGETLWVDFTSFVK